MGSTSSLSNPALQNPDLGQSYEDLYDLLGTVYWEASDLQSKDLIFGVREELADIITALDEQDLATDTVAMAALLSKINTANTALDKIKQQVDQITKNISTAASVVAAISKVISLVPAV